MANICCFKGIVKGKKINCEKLLEIFPCYDINNKIGKKNTKEYNLAFCGTCAWDICAYATNEEEVKKLTEQQIEEVTNDNINEFAKYKLKDFSILFNLDITINAMYEDGYDTKYFHYNKGEEINDSLPKCLNISIEEVEHDYLEVPNINMLSSGEKISDKMEAMKLVEQDGKNLELLSEELRNDFEIVDRAISKSSIAFKYIGEKLRDNKKFMLKSVKEHGFRLQYASERLKNDKEVVLEAENCGYNFQYASDKLKNNIDVINAIRSKGLISYEFIGERLRDNKDFMLESVKEYGFRLDYASERLKDDKEVVLEAVKKYGGALQYASERLKDDEDVVLSSVTADGDSIRYASSRLKANKIIVLQALKYCNSIDSFFCCLDKKLKKDKDFMIEAIKIKKIPKRYISKKLQEDEEFMNMLYTMQLKNYL